jgi:hydrophobic/amphiphilic exporter-1 (mainly G- bacteria), HAE1 family
VIFSIADLFIKRPVLTTVCTLVIALLGSVCIPLLPIEYIPQIAPIQVQISASYVGADPETIETTVTTPIERKLNGTPDLSYFTSNTVAGTSSISAYFPVNTDKYIDQVNVQNNLQQAVPLLPTPVQQQGVTVRTASTSILLVYGFYSPDDTYDSTFISNYVDLYVNDEVARVPGVGQVNIFGQHQYAMRFWLDPNALASRGVTVNDVVSAVQSQNVVVGGGAIGTEPTPPGQRYQIPIKLQGQFQNVSDAENIVIRSQSGGNLIKLKDVGHAELGSQSYSSNAKINGKPGVALVTYQLPGSNALDVAKQIEARIEELKQSLPPGITVVPVYDTVRFIEESNKEVIYTLLEAVGLVVLVIFIFLQNWRATVIPTIAIPVSLIGAFIFAKLLGFSINSLTMFGLVLATGLVVDDAILVIEAVTAKIEQGKTAKQASFEAMEELTGAILATSLVLMAVFVPVAFFPGATGLLYRQFALIIAFSIAVSTFNALTFSPAIAAILLRPAQETRGPLGWFFGKFDRGFSWTRSRYQTVTESLLKLRYLVLGIFVVGLAATVLVFRAVPTGFVPGEDQGSIQGIIQAPDISSLQYTQGILDQAQQVFAGIPEISSTATIAGAGFNGNAANQGIFFANLKPWDERTEASQTVTALIKRLNGEFSQKVTGATVLASSPPPIRGFSPLGGVNMQLQDTTNGRYTFQEFADNAKAILQKANQTGMYAPPAFTQFTPNTPKYEVDINRDQLAALNIDFQTALTTLSTSIGSSYVNQFVLGQRYYQVYVQLDGQYRNKPEDLKQLYVRSRDGKIVSMDQLVTVKSYTGPAVISHFNGYRSILLQGAQAPGYSSGQALETMQKSFEESNLTGIKFSWADLSREEVAAGSLGALIFLFGIIMVFLVLSAQYESYIDPAIILLTVPLAILGALGAIWLRRFIEPTLANDVYCNIALVMLIGLASKNAILIVEFANQALEEGQSISQAAITASQERFRPILMTSIASLVGFFPLVIASGAGANARHSLGTAVFGGLLISTILSLLVVPVLYVIIKNLETSFLKRRHSEPPQTPALSQDGTQPQSTSSGNPDRHTERPDR